ncbi:MAG: hypothetical protein LBT80_05700 [Lactobacillaceae bacterium]|jgi:hypothetical protein|nr:hypothetical protein [Lactobacillaceae bacterium]
MTKKIKWLIGSGVLLVVILIASVVGYTNYDRVYNYFYPSTHMVLKIPQAQGSKAFYYAFPKNAKEQITNAADNVKTITIEAYDLNGNQILKPTTIKAGKAIKLSPKTFSYKQKIKYVVKAEPATYVVSFS